jgi:hypothetical protein
LDDTVEFFNLVLGTKLTPPEKQDLLQFLRGFSEFPVANRESICDGTIRQTNGKTNGKTNSCGTLDR